MVGALDWSLVPAIPPELMLLPNWFPVNLYEMSSWTRGIVIPLAIVSTREAGMAFARGHDVRRALQSARTRSRHRFVWDKRVVSWRNFFLALDRALKLYDRLPWKPFPQAALERARKWMLERLERSEGLGTIYPAMMNSIFALLAMDGDVNDPLIVREIGFLERYEIEEHGTHSRAALHFTGVGHGHRDGFARRGRS